MKYTRTISFRSTASIDEIIKNIQKYHRDISKLDTTESMVIKSAIYWYFDSILEDKEYWQGKDIKSKILDSSLNNSLTNT